VAVAAGLMSSLAGGLNAIGDCLVTDFHRRFGCGRQWLARRLGKRIEELSEPDELKLAKALTLALGLVATAVSIVAAPNADIFSTMTGLVSAIGTPLLAVFLLGMLTRRATATAALMSIAVGGLATLSLATANKLAATGILSLRYAIAETWNIVFGFAFTFTLGYLLSFMLGRRKTNIELRGLVAGYGRLGVRSSDEAIPLISLREEQTSDEPSV